MPIKGTSAAVGKVVGTKRYESAFRTDHMDAAIAEALQIEVPGVLKRHGRNAEGIGLNPMEKIVPAAQRGTLRALLGIGSLGPGPAHKAAGFFGPGFRRLRL